jgi:large subunit ribosomal protein L21
MFAVFKTGGKQYRAKVGDTLRVELLTAEAGQTVELNEVLMVGEGADAKVGAPYVAGAKVLATVKSIGRADKIKVVKFRRRKHHRKQMGHRQWFTELTITAVNA